MPSWIADPSLAPEGERKIAWAAEHMPVLNALRARHLKPGALAGLRVAMTIHLEAKTAYLAQVLHAAGAEVFVSGSNPLSTRDDIAAALAASGVTVYGRYNPTPEDYQRCQELTVEAGPDFVIDDGADLCALLHTTHRAYLPRVRTASEETTTGVKRLRAMATDGTLAFPVIAANDAACKRLFDNRYGTGQSAIAAIASVTNLFLGGKRVVVAGYGWCGRGVARYARGMGAQVIVCEVDPIKALEAHAEGYAVMPMLDAAAVGDVFITATGNCQVISAAHLERMKDGAILANAGHFDVEVDVRALRQMSVAEHEVRPDITEFRLADGRHLHLLAQGPLINIAAAQGHPVEIMDLSFAVQARALCHLVQHHATMPPGVHDLPAEIDDDIAHLKLETAGLRIDALTASQQEYLRSWR
ncbi:MAG: adenosylhomocysteinase [Anaerolineae bacterium]